MRRVRLIHWNASEGASRAEELRSAGYEVWFKPLVTPEARREVRSEPPDVFVIDLSRLPMQGRDVGMSLRVMRNTRSTPIVFAGGEPDKVARIK